MVAFVVTPIRVRYSETDQMGQAYYANYLIWFEAARGHLMRELGIPYGTIESQGFFLPVSRFWARLAKPARYDDALGVHIRVVSARSRVVEFHYQVRRHDELLAEGGTTHVSVDREGRPARLPPAPLEALGTYAAAFEVPAGARRGLDRPTFPG
jgi:acyl-CoA thioester hydrolase